jgi:outer membrane protein OmpA-like peptidoglycan-associated protein
MNLRAIAGSVVLALATWTTSAGAQGTSESSASLSASSDTGVSADATSSGDSLAPEAGTLELGAFFGMIWISKDHSFRNDVSEPYPEIKRPISEFGLRAAYFPMTFVGGELEGALGVPAWANRDDATLFMGRAHVIGQLPGSRFVPFALLGIGGISIRSNIVTESDPSWHIGAGLKVAVNRDLDVRLDLRDNFLPESPYAERSSKMSRVQNPEILLGLSLVLGRSEPKAAPPPPKVVNDRDHDGFLDPVDKCPDEPGVAPDGCPIRDTDGDGFMDPDDECPNKPGVAPDGCPIKDSDGDGFLDPDDKCPHEKGIAPDGCPAKDTDGDGILDPDDKCPTEPENKNGFEDDDGCPDTIPEAVKKFTGVIKGIEFDKDKDKIRKTSFKLLDQAVKVLTDYPKLRIEISGHTDTDGSHDHNMDLSQRRAASVKQYLVDKGIDDGRIQTRGAGPDEPLVPNTNRANKQKNRRIEFKLLE